MIKHGKDPRGIQKDRCRGCGYQFRLGTQEPVAPARVGGTSAGGSSRAHEPESDLPSVGGSATNSPRVDSKKLITYSIFRTFGRDVWSGKVIRLDEAQLRSHLDRRIVESVEETLNALLDAKADALCGAKRY